MKALMVIDMQNVCVGDDHAKLFQYDNQKIIDNANRVITDNAGNLVIYIKNFMKKNLINTLAPFHAYEGTSEVELVSGLQIVSDHIFLKYKGNAFSNSALDKFLKKNDVDTIEIIGVDGGGCVALTALGAIKNGYHVIVNTQAIGTMFQKNKEKYFRKLKEQGAEFI